MILTGSLLALLATLAPEDLYRGQTLTVSRSVEFIFRSGHNTYRTLKSTSGLSPRVEVTAPAGLEVKVLSTSLDTARITNIPMGVRTEGRRIVTTTGSGDGYRIRCTVELRADQVLAEGEYDVKLRFPGPTEVAREIGARDPEASAGIRVAVWDTPQSKGNEMARRKAEAEAARWAWWLRAGMWVGAVAGGIVGLVAIYRFFSRLGEWLSPAQTVTVRLGLPARAVGTVTREVTVPLAELGNPHTPLEERCEALTFLGGKASVRVACTGAPVESEPVRILSRGGPSPSVTFQVRYDVVVTVEPRPGARGVYLARTPIGNLKIVAAP